MCSHPTLSVPIVSLIRGWRHIRGTLALLAYARFFFSFVFPFSSVAPGYHSARVWFGVVNSVPPPLPPHCLMAFTYSKGPAANAVPDLLGGAVSYPQ
jgi:hypothetical protein